MQEEKNFNPERTPTVQIESRCKIVSCRQTIALLNMQGSDLSTVDPETPRRTSNSHTDSNSAAQF